MLCSLTELKINILPSALYPGCHKEAHIIRARLRQRAEPGTQQPSEDTPSLASIVSKVNSFDRRLDVGNIQLYLGRTLVALNQLLKQLCWRFSVLSFRLSHFLFPGHSIISRCC